MSINGTKSKDFHKFYDDKGPTLTLIKTVKNHIFGGFTPLSLNILGDEIVDKSKKTFIFSLNSLKQYNMIDSERKSIRYESENGPVFGDYDFGFIKI